MQSNITAQNNLEFGLVTLHLVQYCLFNARDVIAIFEDNERGTIPVQNAGNEQEVTGSDRGEKVDGGRSRDASKTKRWMASEEGDGAGGAQDKEANGGGSGDVCKTNRWMAAEEVNGCVIIVGTWVAKE
ncbi:hypothetical protein FQA39_LY11351 [Lamprigera yunnana]|nr:hypothetical protein FQA39_LY11351 [Lamprigera yunnana]